MCVRYKGFSLPAVVFGSLLLAFPSTQAHALEGGGGVLSGRSARVSTRIESSAERVSPKITDAKYLPGSDLDDTQRLEEEITVEPLLPKVPLIIEETNLEGVGGMSSKKKKKKIN